MGNENNLQGDSLPSALPPSIERRPEPLLEKLQAVMKLKAGTDSPNVTTDPMLKDLGTDSPNVTTDPMLKDLGTDSPNVTTDPMLKDLGTDSPNVTNVTMDPMRLGSFTPQNGGTYSGDPGLGEDAAKAGVEYSTLPLDKPYPTIERDIPPLAVRSPF